MGKQVAKLVYFSFVTRVLVDENATDEEIVTAAQPRIRNKVHSDLDDNLVDIKDDLECPAHTGGIARTDTD